MRNFRVVVALIALAGMCMAAATPSDGEHAAKKSTKHHAVSKDETAEKLRQLKEVVDQQQAALQRIQQQLQQTQEQLQQTQQQLTQTQQTAQQADTKVATVETNTNLQVQKVQADLTDVKTSLNTTTQTAQKAEKGVADLEHPSTIAYKQLRLTPGGFLELTGYYRSHATLSDLGTSFGGVPVENQPNTKLTEYGQSARSSRIFLRTDADVGKTKLAAYFEMDFNGTSPTANPNQTTSYTPRLRQAWGRAKFSNGWSITGGQTWNLITLNRKAADADAVWIPNTIDAQYVAGYDWGRFAELRVSKTFGKDYTLALALSNPSAISSVTNVTTTGVGGVASLGTGLYGNSLASSCSSTLSGTTVTTTCTNTPTYSTNLAPDVAFKLAYDVARAHIEVKGVGRFFRDRVLPTATTPGWDNTALGGGIGAGTIVQLLPKKVDFIAQGLYGKGISRYEDSGQYDFVLRNSGIGDKNLQPIQSFSIQAGFETHPLRKAEVDVYFGDEYYARSTYPTNLAGTEFAGYGARTATNTGCFYEVAAQAPGGVLPACTANNRNLAHGTIIGYYDLYKGSHGTLRYGAQYEYIHRGTWSGSGGLPAGSKGLSPTGVENVGYLTMRYFLP